MNNLAYTSQKPDVVVPKIEEIVRKDLGVETPVPYKVDEGDAGKVSVGSMLSDAGLALFGGKETLLFSVAFDIAAPRPVTLTTQVDRQGVGCHVGTVVFTTKLAKPVKGEVFLEAPKTFGTPKFQGDAEVAGKLNGSKDLLKKADKFARTKSDVGGGIKRDRYFKVAPAESGSVLVIGTLPRATSMGMGATTDAKDFIDLAKTIEDLL